VVSEEQDSGDRSRESEITALGPAFSRHEKRDAVTAAF
jgi:hypothetical protein